MSRIVQRCSRARGLFLIALSSFGFAAQSGLVHLIGGDVCPVEQTGIRGAVAWLFTVICLSFALGRPSEQWLGSRKVFGWLALRGFMGLVANACAFFALSDSDSLGDASALIFTSPLFTAFYAAILLGERPSPTVVLGLLLGFAGTMMVARPSFLGFHHDAPSASTGRSSVFAIVSAMTGGFVFVALRRTREEHFLVVMHWQMIFQFLALLVAPATCGLTWRLEAWEWLVVLSYGVLAFGAQLCMTTGARLQSAAAGSGMRTIDIFIAYGIQAVAFPKDSLNPISLLGSAFILIGVSFLIMDRVFCTKHSHADHAPVQALPPDEAEANDDDDVEAMPKQADKTSHHLVKIHGKKIKASGEEMAHLEQVVGRKAEDAAFEIGSDSSAEEA